MFIRIGGTYHSDNVQGNERDHTGGGNHWNLRGKVGLCRRKACPVWGEISITYFAIMQGGQPMEYVGGDKELSRWLL